MSRRVTLRRPPVKPYLSTKDPYLVTGSDAIRLEENMKNAKFDKEGYERGKRAYELFKFDEK